MSENSSEPALTTVQYGTLRDSPPRRPLLEAERPEVARIPRKSQQAAEKVVYFVIPSEARNLYLIKVQEKRDSSPRSVPRFAENAHRERNDKSLSFSAACYGFRRTFRNDWRTSNPPS